MMKSVVVAVVLFGLSCTAQFIPGQQVNAHEAIGDKNARALHSNTGLYHQHTINFPGSSGASENAFRAVPTNSVPIPTLRSPINPAENIPPQHVIKQTLRRPQHIAAPKHDIPTRIMNHIESNVESVEDRREREQKEAESAHYSFDSSIQDTINDHAIVRQESRNGLALKGMYSYSDGFYTRTVHYEADEHGYRVVKEEITPIGDGPVYNPKGKADVSSSLHGSYSITADDFVREPKRKFELEKDRN